MSYDEALQYVISCYGASTKKSFDDMRGVLAEMGDPHKNLPKIIHVAGTNGKGSVCAMLSSVLRRAGYGVGMFTSPHLARFNERLRMNGEDIDDATFAEEIYRVKTAVESYLGADERLSYFQLLTLAAFDWFSRQAPDFVILEVGIGGRLDSTNVAENPSVCVITSISADHTEILGETPALIAREKAGIIKAGAKTAVYFQDADVLDVISGVCSNVGSELYCDNPVIEVKRLGRDGCLFDASCRFYDYKDVELSLAGGFQPRNAACALLAVSALRDCGVHIPDKTVYEGLKTAAWPGRMEIVRHNPVVVLDGAHNADGAKMLAVSLTACFAGAAVILIVGVLKGKEYGKMLAELVTLPFVAEIIVTSPKYAVKAVEPDELLNACSALTDKPSRVIRDCERAVDAAIEAAGKDGVVCCAGSLYLVGDAREYLKGMEG